MGRFPLVHALGTALIDHALGVAQGDVLGRETHRLDQLDAGDARRPGAVAHQLRVLHVAAGHLERVDQPGGRDDRRPVLVIVEDRNVHDLAQPLLDNEAVGRLDILEVDAAERRAEEPHAVDELVDIGCVDLEVDGIDVREALEQHRLAFHHRLGCQCAEIAEPEDSRAVGNHRDQIAACGVVERAARILGDRLDGHRHARRVCQRQVALGRHRLGRVDLQLARPSRGMEVESFLRADRRSRGVVLVFQRHGSGISFPTPRLLTGAVMLLLWSTRIKATLRTCKSPIRNSSRQKSANSLGSRQKNCRIQSRQAAI